MRSSLCDHQTFIGRRLRATKAGSALLGPQGCMGRNLGAQECSKPFSGHDQDRIRPTNLSRSQSAPRCLVFVFGAQPKVGFGPRGHLGTPKSGPPRKNLVLIA